MPPPLAWQMGDWCSSHAKVLRLAAALGVLLLLSLVGASAAGFPVDLGIVLCGGLLLPFAVAVCWGGCGFCTLVLQTLCKFRSFASFASIWNKYRRAESASLLEAPEDPEDLYIRESTTGARLPPSRCALLFCPCQAISGYETGDPTLGACEGVARKACRLHLFSCGLLGGCYALAKWKPDPSKIKGDGQQRTVKRPCIAALCVGSPCAISFWESGDLVRGLCRGDAKSALVATLCSFGTAFIWYAPCWWTPNAGFFSRTKKMHTGFNSDNVEQGQELCSVVGQQQLEKQEAAPGKLCGNYLVCRNYHIGFQRQTELYAANLGAWETMEDCIEALTVNNAHIAVWEHGAAKVQKAQSLHILRVPKNISLQASVPYHHLDGVTTFQKVWVTINNRHMDLRKGPCGSYRGSLGQVFSNAECIGVLLNRPDVDYAVWRPDKDNVLHIFDMSKRIAQKAVKYYDFNGAVSFQKSAVAQ